MSANLSIPNELSDTLAFPELQNRLMSAAADSLNEFAADQARKITIFRIDPFPWQSLQ
jgi:hypothetical protein